MANLKYHPNMWLRDDAAAAINALEDKYGKIVINSAGRTVAEQQDLIDRYDRGEEGIYIPYRPAAQSPHVRDGGIAVDIYNYTDDRAKMNEFGFQWTYGMADPPHYDFIGWTPPPAPTPKPEETSPEEDFMKIIRWNSLHCFAVAMEAIYHIPDTHEYGELQHIHGRAIDVDNHGLTTILLSHGIHWDAVDAVLNSRAFGTNKKYWSRLMAEGIAIRGKQDVAQKTLEDVLKSASKIK